MEIINYYLGKGIKAGDKATMIYGVDFSGLDPDLDFDSLPSIVKETSEFDITDMGSGIGLNKGCNLILVTFKNLEGGSGPISAKFQLFKEGDPIAIMDETLRGYVNTGGTGSWYYFCNYTMAHYYKSNGNYYWKIITSGSDEPAIIPFVITGISEPIFRVGEYIRLIGGNGNKIRISETQNTNNLYLAYEYTPDYQAILRVILYADQINYERIHKFRVGDQIHLIGDSTNILSITFINQSNYACEDENLNYMIIPWADENLYELVGLEPEPEPDNKNNYLPLVIGGGILIASIFFIAKNKNKNRVSK